MTFECGEQDLAAFKKDGYLRVDGLFDADEVGLLDKISKADQQLESESHGRKDELGMLSRLAIRNDLDDRAIYTAIVRSRRIVETMSRLLGDEVYHYHHKVMLKEPRVGGAWEWHQDYGYWYNFGCLYPDMASCLIAIDPATCANGCLQVLRGSHLMGRVEHGKAGEQVGADLKRVEAARMRCRLVHCEMQPGDALFFHSNLLHCSEQNTSDRPRWSLICCYNTRHNDPFLEDAPHNNYQPLEVWPDERVADVGRRQYESLRRDS